jgi:hypothetical protein
MNDKFGASVSVLLPSEWLCGNNEYCDLFSENHILYKDGDHLSHYGSVYLARKNLHKLVEVVGENPESAFHADHARHMQRL